MRTPTPYHVYQTNWNVRGQIQPKPNSFNVGTTIDKKDIVVCQCSDLWLTPEQNRENAEWIAKACNLHDEMVAAGEATFTLLKEQYELVIGHFPDYGKYDEIAQLEAVLEKARGE